MQRNFYKEIKDVPLIITKDKIPYLILERYDENHRLVKQEFAYKNPPAEANDPGVPKAPFRHRLMQVLQKKLF